MGNLLYFIAVVLFAYSVGSIIHVLLVIAVISIVFTILRGSGRSA